MPLLGPVFHQELVASARRARYFLWRVLYASLLLAVLVLVYLVSFGLEEASIPAAADFARYYLRSFAALQLAAVLLLGPALAAGLIARERERRTIEYLFTTHLTSTEIVLDKLAASIAQLTTAILAGVPVLAIAMLLGGITLEQVLLVTLVTLSTIAVVTSISLAASAASPRAREAVAVTYGVLFVAIMGPPLLSGLARGSVLASAALSIADTLRPVDPLRVIGLVIDLDQPHYVRWSTLRLMVTIHLLLSAVLLLFSAYGLRRFSLASTTDSSRPSAITRWLRPSLKDRPLVWREMFAGRSYSRLARGGRVLLAALVTLAILGTLWQFVDCAASGSLHRFTYFAMWLGTILESLGLLLAAAWASNSISSEREKETWTTLVSTPLEAREIIFGKLAGSLYAARLVGPPLALVWGLTAVAQPRFIPAIAGTLLGLASAALAGSMLGIFFSFWCANATRALGATLGCVFAAITLGTCCIFPLGIINPLYLLLFPGFMTMFLLEAPSQASVPLIMAGVVYGGAWLVAIAVHLGGAWILWAICVSGFERFAGRIDTRPAMPPLPGASPPAPV